MNYRRPARVAVVGTGTVGAAWAAYYLAQGFDVTATDPAPGAESALRQTVSRLWPTLDRIGIAPGASRERLSFSSALENALDGAEFVQECAPERQDLKASLFRELTALLPPEVVVASSTSGLLMTSLQDGCNHPERCVTAHPFNPPHLMPLVEVVGGEGTSPETIEYALAFYREIGKVPIHVRKEVVGHIANRLQAAILREAIHLVHIGAASARDIDDAVTYGPGMRWSSMGPLLTFHLAGGSGGIEHFFQHLGDAYNIWFADLGDEMITPNVAQEVIVGVIDESAHRSIEELEADRDAFLEQLLGIRGAES